MGNLVFQATLGGQVNLVGPNTASTFNLNVPATSSTIATLTGTETFTNKTLTSPTLTTPVLGTPSSGTLTNCTGLPNAGLTNSSVTVGSTSIALGATATTIAGLTSLATNTLTSASATALTLQSAGTTAITVDTSQNVGIGTATPSNAKLNSIGADTAPQLNLYSNSSGSLGANFTYKTSSGDLYMATNGYNSSSAPQMVLSASGNVGIGTTSPTVKLHVSGDMYATGEIDWGGTGSGASSLGFLAYTGGNSVIGSRGATALAMYTNGTERMRIDSSGNLLVGQSSTIGTGGRVQVISNTDTLYSQTSSNTAYAALILNVQNTAARLAAFQYGNTTAVGTITTNGTTTSYNVTSDYRLKENIVPLTGALAKISQLKPSTYNYKSKPEESIEGFIAHELQLVIPHAVTGDKDAVDADGKPLYQGVDASFLIPHLVAAIQELKAINDTQAETINALTARVVALEAK